MTRGIVIAAALLALAGTGGWGVATASSASGYLVGTARVAPTCPVQRVGQTCSAPYHGRLLAQRLDRHAVEVQWSTARDGTFRIRLCAGRYRITRSGPSPFPLATRVDVRIEAGRTRHLTLVFDTGIR